MPTLLVVRDRGAKSSAVLLAALLVLPYIHLAMFARLAAWWGVPSFPGPQFTFFWMPLVVAAAWFFAPMRVRTQETAPTAGDLALPPVARQTS